MFTILKHDENKVANVTAENQLISTQIFISLDFISTPVNGHASASQIIIGLS
jgi:hypothetical protein